MDRSGSHRLYTFFLCLLFLITACGRDMNRHTTSINPDNYPWLKGKRIFLDPGHGISTVKDLFRTGPGAITEEEVNLKVSRILSAMLEQAGATVLQSRRGRRDIPLEDRIKKAEKFKPDLLVSIHHNGTMRRMDGVNYPCVLIWGSHLVRPASYDAARMLLDEFHRMMDERGTVITDFAVFPETGTRILRETRYLCPGILGEGGFFSDPAHALRLADPVYSRREAEAYFAAIAEYCKRGIPTATVTISSPLDNTGPVKNLINEKSPLVIIQTASGADNVRIDRHSFRATLNGVPIKSIHISDGIFRIDYGRELYPGTQQIQFSFRNARQQHSMIYRSVFTLAVKKGDYDRLVREGTSLIQRRRRVADGVRMLKTALSMEVTGPGADVLLWHIARGYGFMGDRGNAAYHYARLWYFYPMSPYRNHVPVPFRSYRYPVEYLGKVIPVTHDPDITLNPTKKSK